MKTLEDYLAMIDDELLIYPEYRRALTEQDPMLFALIYLPHHLTDPTSGKITLAEFHVAMAEYGLRWLKKELVPMEVRDTFIAPRECGKSTWVFLILPLWGAAHGHVKFIAAFSDAAAQAEGHLQTFKNELETNELLQADYPEFCQPKRSNTTGRFESQSANRIVQSNGFVFDANGIDTNSLGKKYGTLRPDLIILDDIEKGEKNYSEYQAGRQKDTVFDDIAPMNMKARMVFVGTTTMPNSVMDQFRKAAQGYELPELEWIKEQQVEVHYFPAILANDLGEERSIWPDKWPLEWLTSQRHTRTFQKNFMNKPVNADGKFWSDEDIRLDYDITSFGNTILSVDPAVTRNKVSDYTGISVVSRAECADGKHRIVVRYSDQIKGSPETLAERVMELCELYSPGVLYVETNQGGDLWKSVFKDVPAKYRSKHQTESKHIRAERALNFYQQDKIRHTQHFPVLEEQMYAFPNIKHDDVLDSAVSGILYFLDNRAVPIRARQTNYLGE